MTVAMTSLESAKEDDLWFPCGYVCGTPLPWLQRYKRIIAHATAVDGNIRSVQTITVRLDGPYVSVQSSMMHENAVWTTPIEKERGK